MTRIPLSDVHFALGQYIPGLGSFTNLTSIRASMWLLPDVGMVEVLAALPNAEPHWFPIHTVTKMVPMSTKEALIQAAVKVAEHQKKNPPSDVTAWVPLADLDEPVSTGDAGGSPKREGKKKPAAGTKG